MEFAFNKGVNNVGGKLMRIINDKYELKALLNNPNNEVKNKYFDEQNAKSVRGFHSKFNEYKPTPLVSLDGLAKKMNVSKILALKVIPTRRII